MGFIPFKLIPTVVPANPFNPDEDAHALHKALGGFGISNKVIISVIGKRTNQQRQEIAKSFKNLYGKNLTDKFKKKLQGDFKNLVVALMTPLMPDYFVSELRYATLGFGTREEILIEILCSLTNEELRVIKTKYKEVYGVPLEHHIKDDTSGVFLRIMVSLCRGNRDESDITDLAAAEITAKKLYESGVLRPGTDESIFLRVFCYRNFAQLRLIFECYESIAGTDIKDALKGEFSGDSLQVLLAIMNYAKDPIGFYAKNLHRSMKGLGTNDRQLIRHAITRCEIDMGNIKEEYAKNYGETLAKAIKGDCSGNYKRCLLTLIGEEKEKRQDEDGKIFCV